MPYVTGEAARSYPDGTCVLCYVAEESDDASNHIVHRGDDCFVIMNLYPYTNGHVMVVPFRHTSDLGELSDGERLELLGLGDRCVDALRRTMRPDGFNLGLNLGRSAGAGIEEHLHLHVVPRWNGDTNFMTVLGQTRVISEALCDSYEKLREAFQQPLA